jgi:predicted TIM-barrel fold metal-dependent hydrolase
MQTIDIHTHLLNPSVKFHRLFDRLAVRLFARRLGIEPKALQAHPFEAYVEATVRAIRESKRVEKSCLFPVDARCDERGREIHRDPTVCAFTEDVLEVARRYPDRFIPFLSVNPLRPDALERLERHAAAGCRGAKFLQNYWLLDLNREAFVPYYEKLVALGLPLVIHLGNEFAIRSSRRYEDNDMLRLPLECGVTVIAAHMSVGRLAHPFAPWRNFSRAPATFDRDYFDLLEMLEALPNLYADLAAILVPLRARVLPHLSRQTQIHHKLLFGTDWPVPFTVGFNSHGLPRETVRRITTLENPFDRYVAVLLEYFPEESPIYSNWRQVLPKS